MPIATILSNNNDTNILHPPSPTQPFRLIYSLLDDHLAPINTRSSSVMTTQLSFSLSFYLGLARLSNALNLWQTLNEPLADIGGNYSCNISNQA